MELEITDKELRTNKSKKKKGHSIAKYLKDYAELFPDDKITTWHKNNLGKALKDNQTYRKLLAETKESNKLVFKGLVSFYPVYIQDKMRNIAWTSQDFYIISIKTDDKNPLYAVYDYENELLGYIEYSGLIKKEYKFKPNIESKQDLSFDIGFLIKMNSAITYFNMKRKEVMNFGK